MDLNERKMRILKSIVDEYIVNGEPVGSKHLVESGNMSLSPATIRNEMSELEEMGYLDKPHTSAGRIPSNAAYRIYIEQLMEAYRLNVEELNLLNELTRFKMDEMEKMVSKASKVISEITNCATLSLMTSNKKHVVSRFDALLIDENSIVLVMVLPDNSVKSQHLLTDVCLDARAVEKIKTSLNKHLCNISLDDVALPVLLELENDFGTLSSLVTPIVRCAYDAVCGKQNQRVKVDGITNLLSYPEFTDVGKVKNILEFIENNDSKINEVLRPDDVDSKGLKVYIGDENRAEELSDTSVVYCNLPIGNGQNAVLGIIGPKRMDYKKVISALRQLANTLDVKSLPGGEE
ncbi:MAG: heat-inducible transcription repressor HrcA [Clostridia bacterium]|nr:heat-inducible transcription repressor HrcA [Clostridia bacterium]